MYEQYKQKKKEWQKLWLKIESGDFEMVDINAAETLEKEIETMFDAMPTVNDFLRQQHILNLPELEKFGTAIVVKPFQNFNYYENNQCIIEQDDVQYRLKYYGDDGWGEWEVCPLTIAMNADPERRGSNSLPV